jgi:serine/threonine protein phosphatase PrpC
VTSIGSAAASRDPLVTASAGPLLAAGATDAGRQREVNEDRFSCNPALGLFMVIDGVGGQAAGGRAADVALDILRERVARPAGAIGDVIRDGITVANNEIYGLAATRREWEGMACVLTLIVVSDGRVTFGHVGDTRLYKLHRDTIEKLTRDHSPVGEREDAGEISERQAMQHSRRNEVYRDVGSELHDRSDRDFIDIAEVPFESDAALLICSDGLTDLVDAASIARTVAQFAGEPDAVVRALIGAANAAGGKDNVTVVYVEGEQFAASHYGRTPIRVKSMAGSADPEKVAGSGATGGAISLRAVRIAGIALLLAIAAIAVGRTVGWSFTDLRNLRLPLLGGAAQLTVGPTESIAAALVEAAAGSEIIVEPGEYREQLTLKSGVRVRSRVPRGATIRLPAAVPDAADIAAVVARNVSGASFVGFKVSGDAATPLPVGILVEQSDVSIEDVEITGATKAGIEFAGTGTPTLMASDIHDNAGAAIIVRDRGTPRISHNAVLREGTSAIGRGAVVIQPGAMPTFIGNVFIGMIPASFTGLDAAEQTALGRDNHFVPRQTSR